MCISPLAVVEIIYAAVCVGEKIYVAVCIFLRGSGSWGLHPGGQAFCNPSTAGWVLSSLEIYPSESSWKPDPRGERYLCVDLAPVLPMWVQGPPCFLPR